MKSSPEFSLNGKRLPLLAHDELRGDWGQPIQPGSRQITWINVFDRYLNLKGELTVSLTANLWGTRVLPYDCSLGAPSFTSKQRMPYYLAAGLGAASIGVGQIFKQQSDNIYNDEYLTANSVSEAEDPFNRANNANQTYVILTYAGAAILVTDAVLYLIRQGKYQKNLKLYNQWCRDGSISLRPAVDFSSPASPSGTIGLNLKLTF